MFLRYIVLILTFLLTSCSGIDISRYKDNEPKLDLYSYFNGTTRGWGIVQDRSGKMTRQFIVAIDGKVNRAGDLVLTEDFNWNNGEKTQRIWTITKNNEQTYSGRAADVQGEAQGVASGNALNWRYDMLIAVDDSEWSIGFDDWMFLQPEGILLNRASMKKFGFRVGEVTIAFQKEPSKQED